MHGSEQCFSALAAHEKGLERFLNPDAQATSWTNDMRNSGDGNQQQSVLKFPSVQRERPTDLEAWPNWQIVPARVKLIAQSRSKREIAPTHPTCFTWWGLNVGATSGGEVCGSSNGRKLAPSVSMNEHCDCSSVWWSCCPLRAVVTKEVGTARETWNMERGGRNTPLSLFPSLWYNVTCNGSH